MVHREINDIEMPHFLWRKMAKTKHINANISFDTETINGRCFLIADSNGVTLHENEFQDLTGLLGFLNQKKYMQTNNWFYNLEYDTNAILHFLSFEDRKFIASTNYIDYDKYRIQIIPSKELKISVLKDEKLLHTTAFYDLAQFYNFKKLETLAETTPYNKVYVADISAINKDKYYTDTDYNKLINERCIVDCKITNVKADELTNNINKIVVLNSYKSKASIARKFILENITHNLKMPAVKVLDCALKAYHAGHIETCQMGLFENIHNYDINSAYPTTIAELYETDGEYVHNKEYEPDTAYSFYKVIVNYENDYLSPLWYLKSNRNYHATGKFETWITQSELEYLNSAGYDSVILDAYHIMKDSFTEQPFHNLVHELYQERLKAKDNKDEIEKVYKVILNSIYGVTLNTINKKILADYETDLYEVRDDTIYFYETSYRATNMYNPVYGCDITARTRTKIFNDFGDQASEIVSINTDGVYSKVKNGVALSKKLGDYGYKKMKKIMFMGSGRYFLWNDNNVDDNESRFRSIPKKASEICDMMGENGDKRTLKISREKPIKLKESIINSAHYKLNFTKFPIQDYNLIDNFNVFKKVTKNVSFTNTTRYWFDHVDTINDLWDTCYESRPFSVTELDN
jgi:hypothetical protein